MLKKIHFDLSKIHFDIKKFTCIKIEQESQTSSIEDDPSLIKCDSCIQKFPHKVIRLADMQ